MSNWENPDLGIIYLSPEIKDFEGKTIRILSKVIEEDTASFGTLKKEVVIRKGPKERIKVKASFWEDDRQIQTLTIQGWSAATDKPHNASFSFIGNQITTLLDFITILKNSELTPGYSQKPESDFNNSALSAIQAKKIYDENKAMFDEITRASLTEKDIIATGYRKKQLESFRRLLAEPEYFEKAKATYNCSNEALWQKFFEKNPWIFGYGLSYLYRTSLDDKKLEQTVAGYMVNIKGKRTDALMKTRGFVSSLCFVEIKTHDTKLLNTRPYRGETWSPSDELSGGMAQIQVTVSKAIADIKHQLEMHDAEGFPTGENILNYAPKSFLVIGKLSEFTNDHGINLEQFRSFELFRRNLISPEIITFDELYERARFIVEGSDHH